MIIAMAFYYSGLPVATAPFNVGKHRVDSKSHIQLFYDGTQFLSMRFFLPITDGCTQ